MKKRWNTNREKPELLIPAKDLEVLRTAVNFGADAVYIGGEAFSLRAKARNFSPEDMREGIAYAHARGVQVHVAANIYAHNYDLEQAASYFKFLEEIGPDAVLVADPGMFALAREHCPGIPVHISTQANNTNYETFRFWHRMGAARVVCARELSLKEIAQIREKTPASLEIEAFIHGAMCISYSGRCLLSAWFTGRDANRGACTHPCRWKYAVTEETRPGEYFPIEENERGTYIFNSRDLCMIGHLPELARAGVDSLKIEGRMKNALYVATAARTYRKALDDLAAGREIYEGKMEWYQKQIRDCTFRPFTTGFFFGKPGPDAQIYDSNTYEKTCTYLGCVQDIVQIDGCRYLGITQKNKFCVGEEAELMGTDGRDQRFVIEEIRSEKGELLESAPHPQQKLYVKCAVPAERYDIIRRRDSKCTGNRRQFLTPKGETRECCR